VDKVFELQLSDSKEKELTWIIVWRSVVTLHSIIVFSCFHELWQRITIPEILEDEWFKKGYKHPEFDEKYDTTLDDVDAVFNDSEVSYVQSVI
jgi:hypothetical protein